MTIPPAWVAFLDTYRTRDMRARDYGTYQAVNGDGTVVKHTRGLDLRGIAQWLWND